MRAFQLRVARLVAGVGVREIGLYLGVSGAIISRWDNMPSLKVIKSKTTNPEALIFFFNQYQIQFPSETSVSLIINDTHKNLVSTESMSRFQLRGARAILKLSQLNLALATGTLQSTINYLESLNNTADIDNTSKNIDIKLYKSFFEKNGISFPNYYSISLNV